MYDTLRLALYASIAFALFASRANAQDAYQAPPPNLAADGAFRLSVGGQFGFGGEASFSQGSFEGATNLDPTMGLQVQGQLPIARYFLAGGSFAWRSAKADLATERINVFAIDGLIGVRYPIDLGSIGLEPFFSVVLGLAVGSDEELTEDATELGVDFGFRAGATAFFSPSFGAYLSIGYQRDDFFLDDDAQIDIGQFHLDLGVSLRIGG